MIKNRFVLYILKSWIARRIISSVGPQLPRPPFIVTANHTSYFDHFVLAWWILCKGLPFPRFLSKAELFESRTSGWFNRFGGGIPIARGQVDTEAFDTSKAVLEAGGILVLYTEGTRSRDGRLHAPRRGIASLAAQTGVPVIPVGLFGISDVLPIGGRWPKRKRRIVIYNGSALPPPQLGRESERKFAQQVCHRLAELTAQWPEFLADFKPSSAYVAPTLEPSVDTASKQVEMSFYSDDETALPALQQAISIVSKERSAYAVLQLGRAYGQLAKRYRNPFMKIYYAMNSRRALWKSVREIPYEPLAWHAWATLMEQLPRWLGGDVAAANTGHRVAASLHPQGPRYIIHLALLYHRLGRSSEANRWLTYLLQMPSLRQDETSYLRAKQIWTEWHAENQEKSASNEVEDSL
jgi:1-acyl-sn-glycerol-3-phosphate acyltransferase